MNNIFTPYNYVFKDFGSVCARAGEVASFLQYRINEQNLFTFKID